MNKTYSIHTLPVLNWYMFNESIREGKSDYALLFSESSEISEEEGFLQYQSIINAMPYVYADLKVAYIKLLTATNLFNSLSLIIDFVENKVKKDEIPIEKFFNYNEKAISDFKLKKIRCKKVLQKANVFFTDYCLKLDKETEFYYITEYSLKSNYLEIWDKLYGIGKPAMFKRFFDSDFKITNPLLFDVWATEYFPDKEDLFLNDIFLSYFIQEKTIKIKSIFDYIKPIQDYFISKNKFNDFAILRTGLILFADEKREMNKKSNGVADLYETLFNLESFIKININPQTDSLYKFLTYIDQAARQADKVSQPRAG